MSDKNRDSLIRRRLYLGVVGVGFMIVGIMARDHAWTLSGIVLVLCRYAGEQP